jgi:glyoxylase-like metal-dependent hydrolase (beta-lactamase superfamily II)
MQNIIETKFEFRPIGQGLFFTGIFYHLSLETKFSLVYDCGYDNKSTPGNYIDQEIVDFHQEIGDAKIDMLVISHFHNDHINCIFRR